MRESLRMDRTSYRFEQSCQDAFSLQVEKVKSSYSLVVIFIAIALCMTVPAFPCFSIGSIGDETGTGKL